MTPLRCLPSQFFATASALAVLAGSALPAAAITRDEVMVHAKAYAYHPWRCGQQNLTASCNPQYQSEYLPGDYVGLPYDWGGYMSLFEFDQQIDQGYGAGSYPADGELDCTSGLDCSGYVSKCWDTGHWSTSTLHNVSDEIDASELLAGDVFNEAGYHVVLFSHETGNGMPVFYEAVGYNVHINPTGGWSWVSGFLPRRFHGIEGTTAGDPVGTVTNPIVITPGATYTDDRDTSQSSSDVFDGCGADPSKDESGPEYVYEITFTQPGTLTVSVSDDVGVDIDVHLYTSTNTSDCVARHDTALTQQVDCGTYYIVADTFGAGMDNAGPYSLTVQFTPSGQACGNGPPSYDPEGQIGDPCAFPGHENLPFCNENLGADTCIYTSTPPVTSFCSKACAATADCSAFPGGCCEDIGSNEYYCLPSNMCTPAPVDGGAPDSPVEPDAAVADTGNDAPVAPDGAGGQPSDGGGLTDASGSGGSAVPDDSGQLPDSTVPANEAAPADSGGCGCRTASSPAVPRAVSWLLVALSALAFRRRQRR